jgi:hypothetical protein
MRKLYFLLFTFSICALSYGQVLASDEFTYADGSLVGNGAWANHSGTAGTLLVSSGQAVLLMDNSASEDANLPFTPVSGIIYFGLDFTVTAPGAYVAGDDEYFAHFKDSGFGFKGRIDVVAPTGGGDYTIGLSTSSSTAEVVWATDLTFGQTYRATVEYDQDNDTSRLWIDANSSGDTSISGSAAGGPASMVAVGLRQSSSASDETVSVDNLIVAQSFGETLSTNDFSTPKKFSVYPNPTNTGSVNIVSASSSNFGNINVAVYDVLGKQVINKTMTSEKLNVSSLNTGVYIMKITQGKATSTKKLVIN